MLAPFKCCVVLKLYGILSETKPGPAFIRSVSTHFTMLPTTSLDNHANAGSPWPLLVREIAGQLQVNGTHPARALVLVPYAQLINEAKVAWGEVNADVDSPDHHETTMFLPRFETTLNWAASVQSFPEPSGDDITQDAALDTLTAAQLLARVGLAAQSQALQASLMESAWSLARVAAAQHPTERLAWGTRLTSELGLGLESPYLALELAVGRIALAWASSSSYATDALFDVVARGQIETLLVVQGLQPDPLAEALKQQTKAPVATLSFATPDVAIQPKLHAAQDAEDEAQRAAACVLAHLGQGRLPVALIAQDRLLTRRVGALLSAKGVMLHDETGWTLSTTRAAASLMGFLRALPWNASTDAVLDWLKNAPAFDVAEVTSIEKALRKSGARFWREAFTNTDAFQAVSVRVETLREAMQSPRLLSEWKTTLHWCLNAADQWNSLANDAAGKEVLAALHIDHIASVTGPNQTDNNRNPRMSLQEFTSWVNQSLESGSFRPGRPGLCQVMIFPVSQLLGRSVAAVVFPGCDENRLPVSPEPSGQWTPRQRALLGLPSRADSAAAQRAAWLVALSRPHLDVLWRQSDAGEHLMPSGFVQELLLRSHGQALAGDPRVDRTLTARPTLPPMPSGAGLLALQPALSATAYEDLRRCPYRFFALRLLKLQEADELENELGKREFGTWLHATLHIFHQALKAAPDQDIRARAAMLNVASEQATEQLALSPSEFLPFAAVWPNTRDGYLAWLARHEATGAQFGEGEAAKNMRVGNTELTGKLDRIDLMPDGSRLVMDYKTEALDKTKRRVNSGQEDTQLAFYAALIEDDPVAAAYVNVGEKSKTETVPQQDISELRDGLILGIVSDMTRIAQGAALPALGEGEACEFCTARGLCRKDFWKI
jgi:ATP-dependent helicase/nuclease subunit B